MGNRSSRVELGDDGAKTQQQGVRYTSVRQATKLQHWTEWPIHTCHVALCASRSAAQLRRHTSTTDHVLDLPSSSSASPSWAPPGDDLSARATWWEAGNPAPPLLLAVVPLLPVIGLPAPDLPPLCPAVPPLLPSEPCLASIRMPLAAA